MEVRRVGEGRGIRERDQGGTTWACAWRRTMGLCVCVGMCMGVSTDASVGENVDVNVDAGAEGTCACMSVCTWV